MRKSITAIILGLALVFVSHAMAQENNQPEEQLTLERAIEIAFENNFQIKAAEEQHKSAVEYHKGATADFFAKAQANYRYTGFQEAPFSRVGGTEMQTAHENLHHWDVSLVQPLFTGFALSTRYSMTKTDIQIREFEKQQILLNIISSIKTAYYQVLLSEKIFSVAEEQVNALKGHAEDAEKFYNQGLIPQNDLLRSKVALADAIQKREQAEANVVLAISNLNKHMAENIHTQRNLEGITGIPPFESNLVELTDEAIANRPILKALRLRLENSDHAVTLARSDYYPEVSVIGTYEQDGDDLGASNNDYSNQYNAMVGVQAKWTFFEWGKTRSNVSGAVHEKNAMAERILELEDDIRVEVQNAYLGVEVAQKNVHTAAQALEQARENWRITKLQYDQQVVNSTEVLDARAYLTQADSNYYHALYGHMISLSSLERAIGKKTKS
jgi:outer membrane protein